MMGSTASGKGRAAARALQNVSQSTVATIIAATENRPQARRHGHKKVVKVTTTTPTAHTLETTTSTETHAKSPTSTTTRDDVTTTTKASEEYETREDESVPHLRKHDLPPRTKHPRTSEGTLGPEDTTPYEAAEVQTPLMCTTGRMKTSPVLPEDGLCDYLIYTAVSIGTKDSKSANATVIERPTGNVATYKEFRKRAKEAKSTKYAVSLEGDFLVQGEKYVHMYPREIFVPFIDNNIKGFGIAYLNVDITTYLKHHQSRIEYTITRMDVVVKKLDKAAYSFFIIAALAPKREDRSTFANQLYDTVHEYPAVFVSHLTNTKAKPCRVLPSSFWKFEDTNNSYIASIKDALRMKRVINRNDVHHVVSLTAAVFAFTITKKTEKNIDGWTKLQCESCRLVSINDVCKGANFTIGTKGKKVGIHYDYRIADRTWRTYETEQSIYTKLQLAFSDMRAHGSTGTGVAMFDIDADEASKCGTAHRFRRLRHLKDVMSKLKKNNVEKIKRAVS
ncbi:uncharacterized protein LOC142813460 isoform X2 [Rhipicephalus microplus]|uniref:uncharacterized protein LOC142813460 isoform X2 n=1 Tax=Rhipicephalus microplus TaxID=6941 RepID=UPI003F6BC633